jgi:hypothetical protein
MTALRDYQVRAIEQIELAIDAPFRSLRDRPPAKPEAPVEVLRFRSETDTEQKIRDDVGVHHQTNAKAKERECTA